MCNGNSHTNSSFRLAYFEGEKEWGIKGVRLTSNLFTTRLAEVVFAYYRADRGVYRLAE